MAGIGLEAVDRYHLEAHIHRVMPEHVKFSPQDLTFFEGIKLWVENDTDPGG